VRVDLRPMMNPKSVAVIGASRDPNKVGHIILQNYIDNGFSGELYPVNKTQHRVKNIGLNAYRSVLEIKKSIDLAVIAVPAPVVRACLKNVERRK